MALTHGEIRRTDFSGEVNEMKIVNGTNDNGKLDGLRKRAEQLDSLIAQEKLRLQKRAQKERRRLVEIVGTALVDQASSASASDLRLTIMTILDGAVTDSASRRFLQEKEWL